jgi:hypothetical protein
VPNRLGHRIPVDFLRNIAVLPFKFARWTGFDRDRAFYPTVVVVVASYYVLFAAVGGSTHALAVESSVMAVFVLVAVLGFKLSSWLIVAGLAAHGLFDVLHPHVVRNPGVPEWWPAFCLAFDVGIAGLLAWRRSMLSSIASRR